MSDGLHDQRPAAVLLFADGGLPHAFRRDVDPWREFWDLMATVELLCPRWPERAVTVTTDMRL
jgi:hypothetical protein